ncbi:MAG: sensor histidine kinase [Campylobacterales bacterium]|nr:sensor histidine kinase [Campylobacterales bacterium]
MNVNQPKALLLERFHLLIITINALALLIDLYLGRSTNALIEGAAAAGLGLSLWHLHVSRNVDRSAWIFLLLTSAALLSLIALNHFATMSVVFVLLLPLSTLLFLRLRYTLAVIASLAALLGALLYAEHLTNPNNPIAHNPQALFNLLYAAVIIYLFGILYHHFILKTFDVLDTSNRQKSLLLGEVHHRVKNNLNVIASMLGLQALRGDPAAKTALLESKNRIEAMGMVHEMLYQSDDFALIDTQKYFTRLGELLRGLYRAGGVRFEIRCADVKLPLQIMLQLGIITNELITNSLKYAFVTHEGVITISLTCKENLCVFHYGDNGAGCDTQRLQNGKSLGFTLIGLAAKQLGSRFEVHSEEGLHYTLEFEYV